MSGAEMPVVAIKKTTAQEKGENWKHSIIKIYVLWSQTDIKKLFPPFRKK